MQVSSRAEFCFLADAELAWVLHSQATAPKTEKQKKLPWWNSQNSGASPEQKSFAPPLPHPMLLPRRFAVHILAQKLCPSIPHWFAGVVGAAVMPVLGLGVGTIQIVRGVINTREALQQRANDKIWDDVSVSLLLLICSGEAWKAQTTYL